MAWELTNGRPVFVVGMDRYAIELHHIGGPDGPRSSYQDTLQAERELAELLTAKQVRDEMADD